MSITLSATDTLNAKAGTATAITYTLLGDAISSGADSFKNLGQGQLSTSASTPIYPATASTQTIVREIQLVNTTASDVLGVTFYINGSSGVNQISAGFTIVANGSASYRDGLWTIYNALGLVVSTSSVTLTGDVTGTGAGTITTTLTTVNTNTGSFGTASNVGQFTVNGKGLTTAAASVPIIIAESAVTNLISDLALKAPLASPTFTGTTKTALLQPKDIEGEVWIDTTNTQGWAGADIGAWVNAAYAYITANYYNSGTQVGGGIINIAPGAYNQSTAVTANTAGLSIIIRGAGDGWGATTITWTPTSGTAWTLGGGGSNSGGLQFENLTITGGGSINTGSTAVNLNGISGGTFKNVAIVRMGIGINWQSASVAYGMIFINCHIQFCTTGAQPLGENNVFIGGLIGNNTTGLSFAGAAEGQLFGVAFDDNDPTAGTNGAINISNINARISLDGCRFENAGNGKSVYIVQSAGSVSMVSGAFQNDLTSGTAAPGFVTQTGGISKYDGVWHGLGGAQAFTQIYNPTSPASIQVVNPIVAPGSNVATALASLNWLPNSYDQALTTATATATTTETIIKQRIVPLNTTDVGTTFRVEAHGTQVTANTSLIWRLHYGPLGTTADPIVFATIAVAVATTAGAYIQGVATIRTVGNTGTIIGNAVSQGTTSTSSLTTATVLANSTQTNILTITATAAVGVLTVQNAVIEQLQPN